jgi:hypothetical protein
MTINESSMKIMKASEKFNMDLKQKEEGFSLPV